MTFVIMSGCIDLSVGSILSLAGVICIKTMPRFGILGSILMAVTVSSALGMLNGFILARIKGKMGDSFIITFGMSTLIAALALIYTNGLNQNDVAYQQFTYLGKGIAFGIPVPVLIFLIFAIASSVVLKSTAFGRIVASMGISSESVRLSGINTDMYRIAVFALSGFFSGIAAIVLSARINGASPMGGVGYELDAIAAVAIGGTSLAGGLGSIGKTIVGVLFLGIIKNALIIMGIGPYVHYVAIGIIIIVAVLLDVRNKKSA